MSENTKEISESEGLSTEEEPLSQASSSTSLRGSSRSNSYEEEPFSMKTISYICLFLCAGWALYNSHYRTCVYLFVSSGIILCYAMMGVLRDHSMHIEILFWYFRILAATVPIGSINAHLFICDGGCSKFKILATLVAVPLILKVVYPDRNQRILDIIVWSNVHTLGLKAVEDSHLLGLATSLWQTFFFLVAQNSSTWLQTSPEIPFNLGLSGICWGMFIINFVHKDAIEL